METTKVVVKKEGLTLFTATFLLLLALKLTNLINISWLWVFAPLVAVPALGITLMAGFLVFAGIAYAVAFLADGCTDLIRKIRRMGTKK